MKDETMPDKAAADKAAAAVQSALAGAPIPAKELVKAEEPAPEPKQKVAPLPFTVTTNAAVEDELLSIDDVINTDDIEYATIPVPEWKGKIRLGSVSGGDMIKWVESNEGPAKKTAGLRLLMAALVDKDGNRIGSDKHLEAFKKKRGTVLDRLTTYVLQMNGLLPGWQDAVKNGFGGTASDVSPTV